MIHGSDSWMDDSTSYETKYLRSGSYVDVQVIQEAGHHVYADQPDAFNLMVDKICRKEDEKIDVFVNWVKNKNKTMRALLPRITGLQWGAKGYSFKALSTHCVPVMIR